LTIDPRIDRLESVIQDISHRLAGLEARMSALEESLNRLENRLDGLESRMSAGFHSINGHIITGVVGMAGFMVAGFVALGVAIYMTRGA